jgi:hypothetical protein
VKERPGTVTSWGAGTSTGRRDIHRWGRREAEEQKRREKEDEERRKGEEREGS